MSIIRTRYRDIPWEETGCPTRLNAKAGKLWAGDIRGSAIRIQIPSTHSRSWGPVKCEASECDQPKYSVVNEAGLPVLTAAGNPVTVCPHIAEIGD